MTNRHWPIYASPDQAESAQIENGVINRSVVGSGSIVDGATLDHAMLRRSVLVERGATLEHCIVMERSRIGRGAQVRRAIIDQDNDIPPDERIGFDLEQDRRRSVTLRHRGRARGRFPARRRASLRLAERTARAAGGSARMEVLHDGASRQQDPTHRTNSHPAAPLRQPRWQAPAPGATSPARAA